MKIKWLFPLAIIAVAVVLLSLPNPTPAPTKNGLSNSFVLGPVQIFDGKEKRKEQFVTVIDGRIDALHQTKPETALRWIDGKQQWLMPGLIDAHVHSWGNALSANLQRGVTTVVDMFGQPEFLQQNKVGRETTDFQADADIYGAGLLVTAPDGHGTQFGIPVSPLAGVAQAPELIEARVANGSDFIKIVYTHSGAKYQHAPSISKAELAAAIVAAHGHGKLAVVHISDHQSAVDAVAAGADGLVHSFFDRRIAPELLAQMVANKVFVIPTMIVYEGMLKGSLNEQVLLNNDAIEITASERATLTQSFGSNRFPAEFYDYLLWNTKAMHAAGVLLLTGSDAPNPNTAHGWSLVMEMLMFEASDLPPTAILAAATGNASTAFGLSDRGLIAVGRKADLLLLKSSPEEDLGALLRPAAIWKNGYRIN